MKGIAFLACVALLVSCSAIKANQEIKRIKDSASYDSPKQKDSIKNLLQNELLSSKNKLAPVIY